MANQIIIYWASSNPAKTYQLKKQMELHTPHIQIIPIHIDIDEIQSMDNTKVAQDKITKLYAHIQAKYFQDNFHLVCEDTGFAYANANGFPGALVRFYHDSIGNSGICKSHGGFRATNTSCVAYTNGTIRILFTNQVSGIVPESPRPCAQGKYVRTGTELDTTFIPDYPGNLSAYTGLAYSEIPWDIHLKVSARAQSFSDLAHYLIDMINNKQVNNELIKQNVDFDSDLSDSDSEPDSIPDDFAESLCDNLSLHVSTGNQSDLDCESN